MKIEPPAVKDHFQTVGNQQVTQACGKLLILMPLSLCALLIAVHFYYSCLFKLVKLFINQKKTDIQL